VFLVLPAFLSLLDDLLDLFRELLEVLGLIR
jgi:hypothetical protein